MAMRAVIVAAARGSLRLFDGLVRGLVSAILGAARVGLVQPYRAPSIYVP